MIYLLCLGNFFLSILAIHGFVTGNKLLGNYACVLGLGFPLLFVIKSKEVRNIALTLCIVAVYLRLGWVGIICIGITAFIFLCKHKKELAVLFLAITIPLSMAANKIYPKLRTPVHDIKTRMEYYTFTLGKWNKIWFGHGHGSFSKLPENQPKARIDKKWLHTAHSDLIQGLYEYGAVAMFFVLFLALIPLAFAKLKTTYDLSILSAYVCLLFQGAVEFPFHRAITGILGLIIVFLMYENTFRKDRICE